jgi:hypothetical protein
MGEFTKKIFEKMLGASGDIILIIYAPGISPRVRPSMVSLEP